MKKEKPYIIYTKKNKEQVFKYLNNFNIYKVYRTINKNRGYDPENHFELNEDIEDIYFYNVEFTSMCSQKFELSEGQTAVFKNCTFSGKNIKFCGGEVIVLEPNFKRALSSITAYEAKDFYLKLLNDNKEQEIKCYFYRGKNVELIANKNVRELEIIDYEKAKLSNLDFLEYLNLKSNTVNFTKNTHLVVSDLAMLQVKNLLLDENAFLYAVGIQLKDVERIIGTRFKLISMEDIKINDTRYFNDSNEVVTITPEDLNSESLIEERRRLCSQLKGLKKHLNTLTAKELEEQTKILKNKLLQRKIGDKL